MTDGSRPPRPKSARPPAAGPQRRPKRPDDTGKRPGAPGKSGRRPLPAGGRAKLAPFNPKSKPSPKAPPRQPEPPAPEEPMLLQIQFKPPRQSAEPPPDAPLKLKWVSRPPAMQTEVAVPSPNRPEGLPASLPPRPSQEGHKGAEGGSASRGYDRPGKPDDRRGPKQASTRAPYKSSDRPGKPYGDRPARPSGDRPAKPYGDRPARPSGDRPAKPYGDRPARPSGDRPAKPYGDRPARPSKPYGDRPARPSGDRPSKPYGDRPARPSGDRPPYRAAADRLASDAPATDSSGKKFDERRPRDTRIGQGNKAEPKRRLTADESFDLPKPWVIEIQELARPGTGPKVAEAVSKALEHFAEEEFEEAARLAGEAKLSASRSPRVVELLGLALYHSGRWKEALSELLAFRRLTASLEHNHVIADLYRALERPDKALETTAEVSQADVTPETWVETMIVAAGALADKGDLNRAITMLARADPGPGPVQPYFLRHWYARADLLERAGRREEARNLWRKIVAADPDFFDAEERLASL